MSTIGCDPQAVTKSNADKQVAVATEKRVTATEASMAAAKAKRDEYVTGMQKKFDEFDAKYKELEKQAAEAKDDAKKILKEKAKAAKAKRDIAAKKLADVKNASHDHWEKIKDGVEVAFEEFQKAFE